MWNRSFVKCKIQEKKGLYIAIITYSYYGLYWFDEISIHDTLEIATSYLLRIRCGGLIVMETEKKIEVDIDIANVQS